MPKRLVTAVVTMDVVHRLFSCCRSVLDRAQFRHARDDGHQMDAELRFKIAVIGLGVLSVIMAAVVIFAPGG